VFRPAAESEEDPVVISLSYSPPARIASPSLILLAACAFLLPSCNWDGNFTVLGYTTKPQYPCDIRTVYVPIFKNNTYRRGIEFDLTRAVVREIEAKTPYKVVSNCLSADTELSGTIISLNKNVINRDQLNEVREAETTLAVEIVWKDLRTQEILSGRRPPSVSPSIPNIPLPAGAPGSLLADDPSVRPPEYAPPGTPIPPPPIPGPVLVQPVASFIPELGESLTTAEKKNVDRLAIHIVSMMESPW
jgi:hypothetical protein